MTARKHSYISAGGALTAAGALLRIFQLILGAADAEFVYSKLFCTAMLCLMTGGLAVVAYERRGVASFCAAAAAAACLFSFVLGNMSQGGDAMGTASAVLLAAMLLMSSAVMLLSKEKSAPRARAAAGATLAALTLVTVLLRAGVFSLPSQLIVAVFALIYAVLGAGLI